MNSLETLRSKLGPILSQNKTWGALEILIASLILVLMGFLPDEIRSIIPLLLYGGFSLWIRRARVESIGLRAPPNWYWTFFIGTSVGVSIALLGNLVVLPFIDRLIDLSPRLPNIIQALRDNTMTLIFMVIANWLLAAFGEESVFRGYLLNRFLDLTGERRLGSEVSLVGSALLFSIAHGYSSIWYVLCNILVGLIYGGIYLLFKKNLWTTIIAHGMANMIGLVMVYYGIIGAG